MPQPRRTGSTTVSRTNGAPQAQLDAEQAAQIRAAMGAKEQAPSSRVSSVFQNWREVADQLGDPFERNRIPLSKLNQMRRDPMLAFGLSLIKAEHVRSKWSINARSNSGPNLQVANHLDYDLRRIYASTVLQFLNSQDYGFQASAKRFEFRIPSGTFINIDPDSGEATEEPLWSEGGVQPLAWKTFVPLRPEGVEPIWNNLGEFDGIEYAPTSGNTGQAQSGGGGSGASQTRGGGGGTNKEETFKIDLAHSLWFTNERDANFGSIFGYPRLGYAYSYWWSYWFRWAIADRAFERKADPSVLVYYPDGEFVNEDTGERMSHAEYALLMGERMRSGGVIALPSEVYEDMNGRGTNRMWEIDFTKDSSVNFEPFDRSFEYMDVQKLRSLAIPEQAFIEGKGGTSSRNVAASNQGAFEQSQELLSRQIAEHFNRFIIPQWVAANYPEFLQDGGEATLEISGFSEQDRDFNLQLLQLLGQQERGQRELMKYTDIKQLLEERGVPLTTFAEQQRREAEIVAEQQAAVGPTAPTVGGGAPPAPGTAVAPTATGFSYVPIYDRPSMVTLADTGTEFITNLPSTIHYADNAVKGFARILWNIYRDLYRDEYETAAEAIAAVLTLSDEDIELANQDKVKKLLERWKGSQKWDAVFIRSRDLFKSIMKRAAKVELGRLRKAGKVTDDEIDGWITNHLAELVAKAAETTRHEVESFVEKKVDEGMVDPGELSAAVRQHFGEFPDWKADRLVRTEVRDLYNSATLLAASASGVERVMAIDSQGPAPHLGDEDCLERHGKIFPVSDALKERDHPNGTLGWRMVPEDLSITLADDIDGAEFDEEDLVLTLSNDLDDETRRKVVAETVEFLT